MQAKTAQQLQDMLPSSWNQPIDMIGALKLVEPELLALLRQRENWRSYNLPPFMMRLYTDLAMPDGRFARLMLHYFYPSSNNEELAARGLKNDFQDSSAGSVFEKDDLLARKALSHPHAWAMGVHLLQGAYTQYLRETGDVDTRPDFIDTDLREQSAADNPYYEMCSPSLWHSIPQPAHPVMSVVLTYRPADWPKSRNIVKPKETLQPLNAQQTAFMFDVFTDFLARRPAAAPLAETTPIIQPAELIR